MTQSDLRIIRSCCPHCLHLFAAPKCGICGWKSQRMKRQQAEGRVLAERGGHGPE